jgi:hypothetical protein
MNFFYEDFNNRFHENRTPRNSSYNQNDNRRIDSGIYGRRRGFEFVCF